MHYLFNFLHQLLNSQKRTRRLKEVASEWLHQDLNLCLTLETTLTTNRSYCVNPKPRVHKLPPLIASPSDNIVHSWPKSLLNHRAVHSYSNRGAKTQQDYFSHKTFHLQRSKIVFFFFFKQSSWGCPWAGSERQQGAMVLADNQTLEIRAGKWHADTAYQSGEEQPENRKLRVDSAPCCRWDAAMILR